MEEIYESMRQEYDGKLTEKIDGYVFRLRMLERESDAIKSRVDDLNATKRQLDAFKQWLKDNLKRSLTELELTQIVGNETKVTLSKSAPALEIVNESLLPEKFRVQTISIDIDRAAIKDALLNGEKVDGAQLTQGTTLRIGKNNGLKEIK
jgi:hypothetical protein